MEDTPIASRTGTPPLPREDSIFNINRIATPDLSFVSHASPSPIIPPRSALHSAAVSSHHHSSASFSAARTSYVSRSSTPSSSAAGTSGTPSSTPSLWQTPIPAFSEPAQPAELPTSSTGAESSSASFSARNPAESPASVNLSSSFASPSIQDTQFEPQATTSSSPRKSLFSSSASPVLSSLSHNRCISQRTVQRLDHDHKSTTYSDTSPLPRQKSTSYSKSKSQSHSSKRTDVSMTDQDPQSQLSLNDYLYYRGFLRGEGSDVTVRSFNRNFKLHKFILSRSPYFSSLFSSFWESSSLGTSSEKKPVHNLNMDHDENITERAFELAISRLYGHEDMEEERKNVFGLFAVANFLDLPYLVNLCVTEIINRISHHSVANILHFFFKRNYGEASKHIVEACKNFLFAEGYDMPLDLWTTIPNSLIAEVVGSDAFFVPTEWDRCQFLIQIINWRMENAKSPSADKTGSSGEFDDTTSLRYTLDHDVRYCHMTYDELEVLEHTRDCNNRLLVSRRVLREALWLQTGLKQKVLRSSESSTELGVVREVASEKLYNYNDDESFISDENDDPVNNAENDPHSLGSSPTGKVRKYDNESPKRSGGAAAAEASADDDLFDNSDDEDMTYYSVPVADETLDTPWDRPKSHLDQPTKITKYPPFRFAVKFNDVTLLENDRRVYSQTHWYAGNFWNVYIQKVAYKHKHQLGVYIHRGPTDSLSDGGMGSGLGSSMIAGMGSGFGGMNGAFGNAFSYGALENAGLGNTFVSSDFRRRSMGANAATAAVTAVGAGAGTAASPTQNRRTLDLGAPMDLDTGAGAGIDRTGDAEAGNETDAAAAATNNLLNLSTLLFANNSNTASNSATSSTTSVVGIGAETVEGDAAAGVVNAADGTVNRDIAAAMVERGGADEVPIFDDLLEHIGQQQQNEANENELNEAATALSVLSLNAANDNVGDVTMIHQQMMTPSGSPSRAPLGSAAAGPSGSPAFGLRPGQFHNNTRLPTQTPEYVDSRKKISAFFEIYTPSRKGHSSLTCFSSTPDMFNISQSWGWKSASLYLKADELKKGGKTDGLKFMVSIGLV